MADDDVAFLLDRAWSLAGACREVARELRRPMVRRRLLGARLMLTSVLSRLRLGLVLCERREFAVQLRASLADFNDSVTNISRLLGNGARSDSVLDLVRASSELVHRHYL